MFRVIITVAVQKGERDETKHVVQVWTFLDGASVQVLCEGMQVQEVPCALTGITGSPRIGKRVKTMTNETWRTRLELEFKELIAKYEEAAILLIAVTPGDKPSEDRQFHAFTSAFDAAEQMAQYFLKVHFQERITDEGNQDSEARH